jgi:hypothetical protein
LAKPFRIWENLPSVNLLPAAADAGGRTSFFVSLKFAEKAWLVCEVNQGNAAQVTFTPLQATDNLGTNSKGLTNPAPIVYDADTSTATGSAQTLPQPAAVNLRRTSASRIEPGRLQPHRDPDERQQRRQHHLGAPLLATSRTRRRSSSDRRARGRRSRPRSLPLLIEDRSSHECHHPAPLSERLDGRSAIRVRRRDARDDPALQRRDPRRGLHRPGPHQHPRVRLAGDGLSLGAEGGEDGGRAVARHRRQQPRRHRPGHARCDERETGGNEKQEATLYASDALNWDATKSATWESRLALPVLPGAGVEMVFGLHSPGSTAPDNASFYLDFQLLGSGAVNYRSKDGVNTFSFASGIVFAAGVFHNLRIDATGVTNVLYFVDGVQVNLPRQVSFQAVGANAILQPYHTVYKTTGTGLGTYQLDSVQCGMNRI